MGGRFKKIRLTVICAGETHQLTSYPNEYRSLMMLIYDKISPDDFGDCLGMGKCSTCLIEIPQGIDLNFYSRNEETTLAKAESRNGLRLACQILVDERLDGVKIKVIRP